MHRSSRLLLLLSGSLALLTACGPGDTGSGGSGGSGAGGSGGAAPGCTMPTEVACSDQVILEMNLRPDITKGEVTNKPDGAGFVTSIDATAGGAFTADPESYTYLKLDTGGATKVAISDEQSLESMDWDIAFRRYVVRINSGNSGPSCVKGARVPSAMTYEQVTVVDQDVTLRADEYFTDSCELIPDGSGLPSSPATALAGYWTYPGCVKMTDNVFLIGLADGRHVKLIVDSYYTPVVQEQCDTTDTIPMQNTGSANFKVRWAFLP